MIQFRKMRPEDAPAVLEMMRVFYASPAVRSNGSEEIFQRDIAACVSDSPFAEGFIFDRDGNAAGYGMLAHSFSTEFGCPCIWIEDLYVLPAFRGQGVGPAFLRFVRERHPDAVLRLEAERQNAHALHVYARSGMKELPYVEMILKRPAGEEK